MAATAHQRPVEAIPDSDLASLAQHLEHARGRIEERFLDGGNAVLSILDVLNALTQSLDHLTGSLDTQTAEQTSEELQRTAHQLSKLTDLESSRQESFQVILDAQKGLRPEVARMQETLRYLRTFAVTAKITGASVPEFSGFAEEILQRIQDGRVQVDDLSGKLEQLGKGLGPVITKGQTILQSYRGSIPAIVTSLTEGVSRISHHHLQLAAHAASVRTVAARIQTKLGSALSAMQIGDATRQRIEHCQASMRILEEALASPELQDKERQQLATAVRQLVSLQLDQATADFARETRKIVATVASFGSDLDEIGALRRLMSGDEDGDNVLRALELAVEAARSAVHQVETVASEATELSRSTAATVADLAADIGMIQLVRTDIHYMALNTNLRCSRIGEDGKAINVVAAELRNFAAQLDETAERILASLRGLETAAGELRAPREADADGSLDHRLSGALAAIREAAGKMENGLLRLTAQSETAEAETGAHLARLDFDAELGDVLRSCADLMGTDSGPLLFVGGNAGLSAIGHRILKLYTMAAERELHAKIFGKDAAPAAQSIAEDPDDDLMDALF
ncbi:MAG: chemotaxis protein [Pseudorhizobium sp.]